MTGLRNYGDEATNPIPLLPNAHLDSSLVDWIYAFTGAVTATVQNFIGWWPINLLGFMTVAQIADARSGTPTLDLAVPLANWLTACAGKAGYAPYGTYLTSVEMAYNAQISGSLTLSGDGANTIFKASGASNKVLHVSGTAGSTSNPISLMDFSIQSGTSGTSVAGLHMDGIALFFISNIFVEGRSKMTSGMQFTGSQQGQVSGGSILHCTNGALIEQSGGISSNGIDWHGTSFNNATINLYITSTGGGGCDDIFFHGNHLTSAAMGIDAYATGLGVITFTDNHVEPTGSNKGVIVRKGQVYMSGNTIAGTSVDLDLETTGPSKIIGNTINGTTTVGATENFSCLAMNLFGKSVTDSGTGTIFFGNHNSTGTYPVDYFGASTTQGADVAAANNLTLPVGSYFRISGNTQINLLDSTGLRGGTKVTLKFSGTPTVKFNQAASGNFKPLILNSGLDIVETAGSTLTLMWDSLDVQWYEISRMTR
jgi:hypothetical protein